MTLIIALLLMQDMGITNPFAYIGVCGFWVAHVLYHEAPSSGQIKTIVRTGGFK